MIGKDMEQRPWLTLLKQNFHAMEATMTDSDRSSTLQAISRLTEGKHSMNSESV
jgi:hypothetical protein